MNCSIAIGDIIAIFALILGIVNLVILFKDRSPKIIVDAWKSDVHLTDGDTTKGIVKIVYCDIANASVKTIKVDDVFVEWCSQKYLPSKWAGESWGFTEKHDVRSFLLESWDRKRILVEFKTFANWFARKTKKDAWVRISVQDIFGKKYHSKKFKITFAEISKSLGQMK